MAVSRNVIFNLRDQIAEELRKDVLCGRMVEGERISEPKLVERFGVSRTPIREALAQLSYEGLLEAQPNMGLRVAVRPPDSVRELVVQIRRSVETFALRAFFSRIHAHDFVLWNKILADLLAACQERDYLAIAEQDVAFHRSIIRRAHQRDLESIWNSLVARVRSHFWETQRRDYDDPVDIYREHVHILEVFKKGDIEAAVEALSKNIA
ncbi:MAG: GntR family transcriptional regulator [Planctomycetia bacterium]|nr:GntR family transcriptional regulator [Planctomycetia bacterium]